MVKLISKMALGLALVLAAEKSALCQETFFPGYVLYSQMGGRTTYLLDKSTKKAVHTWTHSQGGGYGVYLLDNGNLLRGQNSTKTGITGAASHGTIQEIAKDGSVVWEFDYRSSSYVAHHDLEPLPNGNVLAIAWEVKTAAEATALGFVNRTTAIWPDHIIEIAPPAGGQPARIVWEWHAWDHLVKAAESADRADAFSMGLGGGGGGFGGGFGGGDWMHVNGISYNPTEDLIAFSSRIFSEVIVIDHGTTTAEAKGKTGGKRGKGGSILYRWGKPGNYGAPGTAVLDVVHAAKWIPAGLPGAGNLLAFNNGVSARASSIVELALPKDGSGNFTRAAGTAFGPAEPVWTYENGTEFFSDGRGSAQRLPNGNTILCEATDDGKLREVKPDGTVAWEFIPGFQAPNASTYGVDHAGIAKLLNLSTHTLGPAASFSQGRSVSYSAGGISFRNLAGKKVEIFTLDGKGLFSQVLRTDAYIWRPGGLPASSYRARITGNAGAPVSDVPVLP